MKTFGLFVALVVAIVAAPVRSEAAIQRIFQDIKLPTQVMLEHYTWATPAAASATLLTNAGALATSAATTITSFSAQPDVPRNIVLTTGGTTANIGAGTAVVSGTNIYGKAITENFTISSAQNGATTGAKAFASVTSVLFPATTGASATVSVGSGTKLGLPRCMADAGKYVFSEFNSAYETTRGTAAASASAVESNTFIPNGTPDGSKPVELFYVQNFLCHP